MQSFLDRLDGEARDMLLAVARPVRHATGDRLVRYGDPSRGAYLVKEGTVEATVLLPGGEKLTVAKLGAGGVFGEMALIDRGTCTATVTAATSMEGWFIERDDFRALVARHVPAALRIQHALTLALSDKLRALNARVLEVPAPEDKLKSGSDPESDPLARVKRQKEASFDVRPFLPHLPFFEDFDAAEIDEILRSGNLLELPRGHALFRFGKPSSAVFVVVRGAIEILARHARGERRMAILGPGQLIGYMSAIEKSTHGADAIVREAALLLEIPRAEFEKLYFGASSASGRLRRAITATLLQSLGQTNRHLTRLISLARLRRSDGEWEELEKILASQIVWTLGEGA